MNAMRRWMQQATPEQKARLATLAGTTVGTLNQIAGSYRTQGKPRVEADLAGRLAKASRQIKGVPVLFREELSPACSKCEYARACR